MTKRFEAFKEEYDALCRKYGVYVIQWHDGEIALYDLDHSQKWASQFLEINDKTKET